MNKKKDPTSTLSLEQLSAIDTVCESFEAGWSSDATVEIPKLLNKVSEELKPHLFYELLLADIEKRNEQDCLQPGSFYLKHFPQFASECKAASDSSIDMGICPPEMKIGRYFIRAEIGAGGMGRIYRAFDSELRRDVAIKSILPKFASDPERLKRFENEIKTVARLAHPNIVTLHDVVKKDGSAYAVMELLDGTDLASRIRQGKIEQAEALEIAMRVADGIGAAHEKGMVHRDLKPANIFLADGGITKVLDFGIARLKDADNFRPDQLLTQTEHGKVIGTIDYMSPEQVRGLEVDRRSDVFSLGAVLYEMLTGRKAFHCKTTADSKAAILKEHPEFTSDDGIPKSTKALVLRCLEKDRDDRFQTMGEFAEAAHECLGSSRNKGPGMVFAYSLAMILAMVLISLIAVVNWMNWSPRSDIRSIAVLPFKGDLEEQYLKDGLTFSLTNSLSRIQGLNVRPFHVVRSLREGDSSLSIEETARELQVDALVSGFASRSDKDTISIQVELIDARDNRSFWGANYVQPVEEFRDIQNTLLADISEQLKIQTDEEDLISGGKSTTDLEAFKEYILGQVALSQRQPESVKMALGHFEKAVDKDPLFDMAYVGLSNCLIVQSERNLMDPRDGFEMARTYSKKALEINYMSTDAQISLAMIAFEYDWDFETAERRFVDALRLNDKDIPVNHPTGFQWFAEFLSATGQYEEALKQVRVAQSQDPSSAIAETVEGVIHLKAGQYGQAINRLDSVLKRHSNFDRARGYLIDAFELSNQIERALIQWTALAKSNQHIIEPLKNAYRDDGAKGYWAQRLILKDELSQIRTISPLFLAFVYCKNQKLDEALTQIELAIEAKDGAVAGNLLVHPFFNSLRDTERFKTALRKVRKDNE